MCYGSRYYEEEQERLRSEAERQNRKTDTDEGNVDEQPVERPVNERPRRELVTKMRQLLSL